MFWPGRISITLATNASLQLPAATCARPSFTPQNAYRPSAFVPPCTHSLNPSAGYAMAIQRFGTSRRVPPDVSNTSPTNVGVVHVGVGCGASGAEGKAITEGA